jgi:FSR family fosmidomycin resistance protein-like MFS transporter
LIRETGNSDNRGSTLTILKDTVFHTTAHFSNDLFLSFFAPTLPVLITQMGLLKVQAGILNLALELTALSMPLIGRIADRTNIRKYMVFTPFVTALCITMLGVIPNFYLLFLVLTIGGLSLYFYHAVGPADIADVNNAALGRLMAVWNIAGQVAFMIGPLLVTAVITRYSIRQLPWLSLLGILATIALILIRRRQPESFHSKVLKTREQTKLPADSKARIIRQFIPIIGITLAVSLSHACSFAYLPVYIVERGASLWMSGLAISFYFGAGIIGNIIGGWLHDRIRTKNVAFISLTGFAIFFALAIYASGLLQLALIAMMGVFSFMLVPAMMAMLQENNPDDRSLTNGIFLGLNYSSIALAGVVAGYMLDRMPTPTVFLISAVLALSALVFVPWLKDENEKEKFIASL